MSNHDQRALVFSHQRCCCQVVHPGKIRATEPFNWQLGQLLHAPLVFVVAPPELINIEVRLDRARVYVQALREVLLPLLRIVLRLQRIVHQLLRADRHAVAQVRLLLLLRARIVDVAVLVLVRSRDQNKEAVVFNGPVHDLQRRLHVPVPEAVSFVSCRRNADDVFVPVGLLGVLEERVLLCLLVPCELVRDCKVAVE